MFKTNFDEAAKLWSNHQVPALYNPKISLAQPLLKSCKTHGSKIAQISGDSDIQLTFNELRLKTIRAAQNLQTRGHNTKGLFGVIARNSHNLAPIVFASLAIGSPVNTLDPAFGKPELLHMFKTTEPTLIFCDLDVFDLVKECLNELGNKSNVFTFGGSKTGSEDVERLFDETHNENQFVPVEVDGENETAIIVCSSGTTGLPKGVCLSHAAVLSEMIQLDLTNADDILLCFSSLYWITGWIILLQGTLNGATRIITTQTFTPETQIDLIEKYKVTTTLNAPHHLIVMLKSDRIVKANLSSIKVQIVTGSKLSLSVHTGMNRKMKNGKIHIVYGLSESCGPIVLNTVEADSMVGKLLNLYDVKIVDDDGNRLGVGEDGEICAKFFYRFLGYYNNPKESKECIDEEGFFKTGDIGHFDKDGNLFMVDRKKELLKYKGNQVSPSEIESYLIRSPHIKAACVFGMPDDEAADLPAALVILNEGSRLREIDLFDMVGEHFVDHYRLRGGVYFVDNLPLTPSGKVLRNKAREIAIEIKKNRLN